MKYVVHLIESEEPHPYKAFALFDDAKHYAKSAVDSGCATACDVYVVAADDNRAAVTAAKRGGETLIFSVSPIDPQEEIQRRRAFAKFISHRINAFRYLKKSTRS